MRLTLGGHALSNPRHLTLKFKRLLQICFLFAFSFGLWAGQAVPAQALEVDQVRFGVHPGKTRLVLDLSDVSDYRVFTLSEPYRLVIDLPHFDWRAGQFNAAMGSKAVKDMRHGHLKPGISRIVFDLNGPIDLRSAFVLPAQVGKPDRLVIDYAPSDAATFAAQKGKILGTLEASTASTSASGESRTASAVTPAAKPAQKTRKPLIIIDPGHGGVDPGAVGARKTHEKNVVLALAKELKKQLAATGKYRVMMTREDDRFIKLWNRVKFAREHEADLFVSVHADSIGKSNVSGASVYTLSETASDAQTAKLAARENRADLIAGIDLTHEDKEVTNILVDLAMRDTMNQSKFFANTLVGSLRKNGVKILDNPHRYAGFAVLKAPDVPSVLIEAGFMSNRQEEKLLNSHAHRTKIARGIKDGINAYFVQVAKNSRL